MDRLAELEARVEMLEAFATGHASASESMIGKLAAALHIVGIWDAPLNIQTALDILQHEQRRGSADWFAERAKESLAAMLLAAKTQIEGESHS